MGILIAVFVALFVILLAVVFGCLWLLPLAAGLALVGLAAWTAWSWSGRMSGIPGGIGAWWTANRQRIQAAALIFGSLVLSAIILWCLWARYAPKCTGGGCWSSTTTSASATTGKLVEVIITPERPFTFRIEPYHQLDIFGEGYTKTVRREGADVIATYTVTEPIVVEYEYFRCTSQRPCANVEMPIAPQ